MMLQQTSKSARTSGAVSSSARHLSPVFGVTLPSRSVRCHFREEERLRKQQNTSYPYTSSSGRDYYGGYNNEDPMAGVRENFKNLKEKWDDWPAEDRNNTLIYGSGGLLLLYIANAVLDSVERVPLVPGLLKFVGLIFSSWFIWRYLLFADGRRDLSQDVSLNKLFGRVNDRVEDLSQQAAGSVERAKHSSSSNRLSDNSTSGTYAASELDQNISKALHSMDKLADRLSE